MGKEPKSEAGANYGFPSHQVPPNKKNKKWCLQYIKAFDKEFTTGNSQILRWAYEQYLEWRLLAAGKQPIDQYKDQLGVKKRHGKRDQSWKNLDWSILPIFPRFKKVIKNRLKKLPREIMLSAIDATSIEQDGVRYSQIMEHMINKEFHEAMTESVAGYKSRSPFEKGEPVPENSEQIQMYMQMYPKNKYIMYMLDQIDMSFLQSDWKEMEDEILDDAIDVGVMSTRTYIDNLGRIRIRKRIPEQTICNPCIHNDFSDLIRVGEYVQMTMSELRASVPKGTFTLDELADIAKRASNKHYSAVFAQKYLEDNLRYEWDHEKVTVLMAEWYSADDVAYVMGQNGDGNTSFSKRDNPYWLDKKGLTDQEYVSFYKERGEKREIIRDTVNNVYQGNWIVGTDYIYDCGRQSNMIRAINSINDCKLGTTMYTTGFDSYMRQCEPLLHNIQINWLNYQHQLSQAKPRGVAIEKRSLAAVQVGTQKLEIDDILQMYAETGSFIYTGTDQNGRPYPFKPIEELVGGISDAAKQYLEFIIADIDILRNVLGLNDATDASNPDPEMGKKLAEIAISNTDNALGDLYHAFINMYENTAKKVCMLVPDAEGRGTSLGKQTALGKDAHDFILDNRNFSMMDFALSVDAGISTEVRQVLRGFIAAALLTPENPSGILPEDAFLIEQEKNLYRAYQLLAQKRMQREEEAQQRNIEAMNAQAEGNKQTALAIEQEKQKSLMLDVEAYKEKKAFDAEMAIKVKDHAASWEVIVAKINAKASLDEKQEELVAKLTETELKGHVDLKVATIQAEASKEKKKETASA